jgi:hypothetical protein
VALADGEAAVAAAREGAEHLGRYRELDAAGLDGTAEVETAVAAFERAMAAGSDPATAPAYAYNLALALQSRYDAVGEPAGNDTTSALRSSCWSTPSPRPRAR